MENAQAVVLAGGKGTRMKSQHPKVLHLLCGKYLLSYVLESLEKAGVPSPVLILGYESDCVRKAFPTARTVLQRPVMGTGHALKKAIPFLKKRRSVIVVNGDTPFLKHRTLEKMVKIRQKRKAAVVLTTSEVDDPYGYGRIVREEGKIVGIVEERNATKEQKGIHEINAGFYCFDDAFLREYLPRIKKDPVKKEYYLTALVCLAVKKRFPIVAVHVDVEESLGVNSQQDLAKAAALFFERQRQTLMTHGVTLVAPETCFIEPDVHVGKGTILYSYVSLCGKTRIGKECQIESFTTIHSSIVRSGSVIKGNSYIENAVIGKQCRVGPLARLRAGTYLENEVQVGNFVELKKVRIRKGSKVNHLTYLGDAKVGRGVNVGAGTITCNYDGEEKHQTVIEDDAFIGSNSVLVAPVTVKKRAYIGAGSAITQDVPPDSLAIGRGRQRNVSHWSRLKRKKR